MLLTSYSNCIIEPETEVKRENYAEQEQNDAIKEQNHIIKEQNAAQQELNDVIKEENSIKDSLLFSSLNQEDDSELSEELEYLEEPYFDDDDQDPQTSLLNPQFSPSELTTMNNLVKQVHPLSLESPKFIQFQALQLQSNSTSKAGRKTKADKAWICPCGRRYSLRQTLQFHIKTKHPTVASQLFKGKNRTNNLEGKSEGNLFDDVNLFNPSQRTGQSLDDLDLDQLNAGSEHEEYNPIQDEPGDDCPKEDIKPQRNGKPGPKPKIKPPKAPPLTKYDEYGNKQYNPRKIYMCGQCNTHYRFNEELAYHIRCHHGELPDGTIYGIKRDRLFSYFGLPQLVVGLHQTVIKYRCGCGKAYGCSSSLRSHIMRIHKGERPAGSIGAIPRVSKIATDLCSQK